MRRGPALLLTIALGLGAMLVLAGPASAHNEIVGSTPSPGETLTALPDRFAIDTNNVLLDVGGTGRGFAFEIRGADGKFYEDGCVSIVDDDMFTTARLGAPGKYTIVYQIVSSDGHSVSGTIPFTWAPASPPAAVTTGVASPPGCHGGPAPGKPHTDATSTQTTRTSTVPLGDVLWIGGVIVAVAVAVIITLVVLTRRRRDDAENDPDEPDSD